MSSAKEPGRAGRVLRDEEARSIKLVRFKHPAPLNPVLAPTSDRAAKHTTSGRLSKYNPGTVSANRWDLLFVPRRGPPRFRSQQLRPWAIT
jgi:hypothetical protein